MKFHFLNSYLIVGNSMSWPCVLNCMAPDGLRFTVYRWLRQWPLLQLWWIRSYLFLCLLLVNFTLGILVAVCSTLMASFGCTTMTVHSSVSKSHHRHTLSVCHVMVGESRIRPMMRFQIMWSVALPVICRHQWLVSICLEKCNVALICLSLIHIWRCRRRG